MVAVHTAVQQLFHPLPYPFFLFFFKYYKLIKKKSELGNPRHEMK